MPIGLKIKLDEYAHGHIYFKAIGPDDDESEYIELPVTSVTLNVRAGGPCTVTADFFLKEADVEIASAMFESAQVTGVDNICIMCRGTMDYSSQR